MKPSERIEQLYQEEVELWKKSDSEAVGAIWQRLCQAVRRG